MPGIISALAASHTPFSILTKGSLVRRDLPLLQEAAEHVPVDLSMSIAVYDDELQQSVEPGTPSTAARLATVKAVRDAGLPCAVFLMPVLPYLTDSIAHLDRALGMIAGAGATSVVYSALHLRPGRGSGTWRGSPASIRSSSPVTPRCTAGGRTPRRSIVRGSPPGCSRCCASTASTARADSTRRPASCGRGAVRTPPPSRLCSEDRCAVSPRWLGPLQGRWAEQDAPDPVCCHVGRRVRIACDPGLHHRQH